MAKLKNIIALVGVSLVVGSVSTGAVALTKRTSTAAAAARDHRRPVQTIDQLIRLMDKDMNGTVSKQEFLDFMSQMFDRADVDHSQTLEGRRRGCRWST